jgi:tRNA pseudouridine38-40 synthase
MERYVLIIEYKGTNFSGSQKQPEQKSVRTVQGTLEKAICTLTKQNTKTFFSGRTDAGVHSRGQTVHFDSDIDFTDEKVIYSLNELLPEDVSVKEVFKTDECFHAQKSAVKRFYRYRIVNRNRRSAFDEDCLYIRKPLNVELMNSALVFLKGEHDFSSFKKSRTGNPAKVCTVYDASCYRLNDEVFIDVTANRFLYGMMRTIVGTLLMIEKDNLSPETLELILNYRDRTKAGPMVKPDGLTLMKVTYKNTNKTEKANENILS